MIRPSTTRRSVVHVIVLFGIQRQVDVRAFVLEDVFEPTPGRTALSVSGPDEGF